MLALLLLFVSACVPSPEGDVRYPTPQEIEQRDLEMELWEIGEPCIKDAPRIQVSIARTHEEMLSLTGYFCGPSDDGLGGPEGNLSCEYGRAAGAYRRAREGGIWPFALFKDFFPLVVMWHSAASPQLFRHEVKHWLSECTGTPYRHPLPAETL